MRTAAASGLGNKLIYVGAPTGRDGILGAAFASEELEEDTVDDVPTFKSVTPLGQETDGSVLELQKLSRSRSLPGHGRAVLPAQF